MRARAAFCCGQDLRAASHLRQCTGTANDRTELTLMNHAPPKPKPASLSACMHHLEPVTPGSRLPDSAQLTCYSATASEVPSRSREASHLGMPGAAEVLNLYKAFLREGRKFPNYNVREYVKRKAGEGFRQHAGESDAGAVQQLIASAREQLQLVQRQAVVYTLFARKNKSIMDLPVWKVAETQ